MAIIGIDLGTSNSAAAVLRGGRPVIIPSAEGITLGGKAFPSYVAITADGQMLIGEPARRQAAVNPEGTATAFKRKMGQRVKVRLRDKEFSPEQLSAFLLQKIKRDAEAFLGEPVEKAVVTVPAYFDDNQRSATKDACKIAGLEVLRLVNEPTAASLAYGLDRLGQELRIAVIDLGGGTLDVTIMEFGKGVFEVKATSGDTQLGGTDMDQKIFEHLTAKDQATGKERCLRITGSTRLSDQEKRRMVEEAERYAEQDKKRREEAEKLNAADSLCYQAEKTLADFGSKLSDALRGKIESALRDTHEALTKRDAALASQRAEVLKTVLQEVGKTAYAQAATSGPQPQPEVSSPTGEARPTGSGPGGRVVDAEYQEAKAR